MDFPIPAEYPPSDTSTTTTDPALTPLPTFRIPSYPNTPLRLNGSPLSLLTLPISPSTSASPTTIPPSHIPNALATILHAWHPHALAAFLDTDAWYSLTWTLTSPDCGAVYEIGRVGPQVTFGTLDAAGEKWDLMLSYEIHGGVGAWRGLASESMVGETKLSSVSEIDARAGAWLGDMVAHARWGVAPKSKARHAFAVEYLPMDDPFSDGIPMSPHLLYAPLDLARCTACRRGDETLHPCPRCGMAAYCGGGCQRADWAVHKAFCGLDAVDRAAAIKISEDGGLAGWDIGRRWGDEEEVESTCVHFALPVKKRRVDGGKLVGAEDA